jgi:hypothetical protein
MAHPDANIPRNFGATSISNGRTTRAASSSPASIDAPKATDAGAGLVTFVAT